MGRIGLLPDAPHTYRGNSSGRIVHVWQQNVQQSERIQEGIIVRENIPLRRKSLRTERRRRTKIEMYRRIRIEGRHISQSKEGLILR